MLMEGRNTVPLTYTKNLWWGVREKGNLIKNMHKDQEATSSCGRRLKCMDSSVQSQRHTQKYTSVIRPLTGLSCALNKNQKRSQRHSWKGISQTDILVGRWGVSSDKHCLSLLQRDSPSLWWGSVGTRGTLGQRRALSCEQGPHPAPALGGCSRAASCCANPCHAGGELGQVSVTLEGIQLLCLRCLHGPALPCSAAVDPHRGHPPSLPAPHRWLSCPDSPTCHWRCFNADLHPLGFSSSTYTLANCASSQELLGGVIQEQRGKALWANYHS